MVRASETSHGKSEARGRGFNRRAAERHVERLRRVLSVQELPLYTFLKLAEEAGEAVKEFNRLYWHLRTRSDELLVGEELADTVICAYACAEYLGIDLDTLIENKDKKLEQRDA